MEQGLKERLVGAAVLVIIAVIFIPMLLDDRQEKDIVITDTNIPPKPENIPIPPEDTDFSSRIVPLQPEQPVSGDIEKPEEDQILPTEEIADTISQQPETITTTAPVMESEEPATGVGLSAWVVQLGSFSSKENAESLNNKLRKAGFRSFVEPLGQKNPTAYRVRVGPEIKRADADALNDQIKKSLHLEGIIVPYP
jgi:DedD protein